MQRPLYAFARAHVGPIVDVVAVARDRGARTSAARIWRIETASGSFALKQSGPGRAFAQERAALRAVAPLGDRVPQCIADDDAQRLLLMRWLPGLAGDTVADPAQRLAMFAAAGRLQRAIAALPLADADPVALDRALHRRMQAAIAAADGVLAPAIVAEVRRAWRPEVFVGSRRAWCHRDYAPYNWLVDGTDVRAIDFGHARADHPLVDLVRATAPPWDDPALADAWLAAHPLSARATDERRQLALLAAIVAATWGRTHADDDIRNRGDTALARWLG